MRIPTLFHDFKKLEVDYYTACSKNRYQFKSGCLLIPEQKNYIVQSDDIVNIKKDSKIYKVIEDVIKVKNYDFMSYYQDHNDSPSARCYHSATCLLIYKGYVIYYNLYTDTFCKVSHKIENQYVDIEKVYFLGVADVMNLSRYYSDFGMYLTLLEGGHVLFNIINSLIKQGIEYKFVEIYYNMLQDTTLDERYFYQQYLLEVDVELVDELLIKEDMILSQDKRLKVPFNDLADAKYLRSFVEFYNYKIDYQENGDEENCTHKECFRAEYQGAGQTTYGSFNTRSESFKLEDVHTLLVFIEAFLSDRKITDIFCSILRKNKIDKTLDIYQGSQLVEKKDDINLNILLAEDYQFLDLNTYEYLLVLSSKKKGRNMQHKLLVCGQIMQLAALHVSKYDFKFRPMKNHHDAHLKELLELDDTCDINYFAVILDKTYTETRYKLQEKE